MGERDTAAEAGYQISIKALHGLILDLSRQNKEISEQNKEIKETLNQLNEKFDNELFVLKEDVRSLNRENQALRRRVQDAERQQKKYNLVFYNFECEEAKTYEGVQDLINNTLGVECDSRDIRDAFHFGRRGDSTARPIKVEFTSYKLKTSILQNAGRLKGTKVGISPDYIKEDWEERKLLHEQLKIAKLEDSKAKIKKHKLVIRGQEYSLEDWKLRQNIVSQKRITPALTLQIDDTTAQTSKGAPVTPQELVGITDKTASDSEHYKRKPEDSPEYTGQKSKKSGKQALQSGERIVTRNRK